MFFNSTTSPKQKQCFFSFNAFKDYVYVWYHSKFVRITVDDYDYDSHHDTKHRLYEMLNTFTFKNKNNG